MQTSKESPVGPTAGGALNNFFTDDQASEIVPLYEKEAMQRSKDITNVSYKLAYALLRGGQNFHGQVEITFDLSEPNDNIFADYKGEQVHKIIVNG